MPHATVRSDNSRPVEPGSPVGVTRRRWPRWARWCVAVGVTLMTLSGVALGGAGFLLHTATSKIDQQDLLGAAAAPRQHRTITGAKNILLVGVDARPHQDASQLTRADSIILMHIPADHSQAYLVSLPRDSLVTIPAYDNGATPYAGGKNKINAAFAFGSRGLSGAPALSHGFELLALTVRDLTSPPTPARSSTSRASSRSSRCSARSACTWTRPPPPSTWGTTTGPGSPPRHTRSIPTVR